MFTETISLERALDQLRSDRDHLLEVVANQQDANRQQTQTILDLSGEVNHWYGKLQQLASDDTVPVMVRYRIKKWLKS